MQAGFRSRSPTMKLADLDNITAADVDAALARDESTELELVSVTVALVFPDLPLAQEICLRLAGHGKGKVRANALISLGHLARRFRTLDESAVKPVIENALADPDAAIRDCAHSAADEMHQFLHWNIAGHTYGKSPDNR
jgi:hypothetical protein